MRTIGTWTSARHRAPLFKDTSGKVSLSLEVLILASIALRLSGFTCNIATIVRLRIIVPEPIANCASQQSVVHMLVVIPALAFIVYLAGARDSVRNQKTWSTALPCICDQGLDLCRNRSTNSSTQVQGFSCPQFQLGFLFSPRLSPHSCTQPKSCSMHCHHSHSGASPQIYCPQEGRAQLSRPRKNKVLSECQAKRLYVSIHLGC